MTKTHVAVGEIARVSVWSLRGLGYAFGIAERASRLVAWGEVLDCRTLRMLRLDEPQIQSSLHAVTERSADPLLGRIIDVKGKHLFEAGPPALDLAVADAAGAGAGGAVVRNACGKGLVPALCQMALRDSYGIAALYRDNEGVDFVPRWILGLPSLDGGLLCEGQDAEVELDFLLGKETIREPARGALSRILPAICDCLSKRPDAIGFVSFRCEDGIAALLRHAGRFSPIRLSERWRKANSAGLEIETEDFANLYSLEKRAWAPTSDRSRSQAAF